MALGADAGDIVKLALSSTSLSVGFGLFAGLSLSFIFAKLASQWVNESSRDPVVLSCVTLLLITAAVIASIMPARRAASTDPLVALRYE
jgi:ABC-type antimicrobial peptide transport system permease subunit